MKEYHIILKNVLSGEKQIFSTMGNHPTEAVENILVNHPGWISIGFSY